MRKIREVLRLRLEADPLCSPNRYLYQGQCRLHQTPQKCPGARPYHLYLPNLMMAIGCLFYPPGRTTVSARHVMPDWLCIRMSARVSETAALGGITAQRYPS